MQDATRSALRLLHACEFAGAAVFSFHADFCDRYSQRARIAWTTDDRRRGMRLLGRCSLLRAPVTRVGERIAAMSVICAVFLVGLSIAHFLDVVAVLFVVGFAATSSYAATNLQVQNRVPMSARASSCRCTRRCSCDTADF